MTHISLAGMTDADAGKRLWPAAIERMRSHAAELAAGFDIALPPYDVLPNSMLDADFMPAVQLNVELFFRSVSEGVELSETDTQPLVDRAVRLVRDGMPIEEVLANYRHGIAFFWSQLVPLLEADEYSLIPELGLRITNHAGLVISRIASALVGDARQPRWDLLVRQSEIAADLLAGRDPSGWARDSEIPIADGFFVAVIRMGDPSPGVLTGLRARIGGLSGTFLHRDSGGWTALVPIRPADPADPVRALLSRLSLRDNRSHPQFWIGVAAAPAHADIPAAHAEARTVAETARCLARPETVCHRQHMMFEYAIASGSEALPTLAAILAPLADQPLLSETLDAYIDNQFNHNAVARALFIHRNTVTYRLARITDLTGYDPQDPTGISTLLAARTALRLRAKSFRP
ncbi:PucR family transcriptional regulator [Nocardia huaxiensis]|uniref:Helix-turn-helix domain-containing protein n=1 Tax=Nocardia huaxiensis TaxID=2755382 RepID=A0A7D6VDT7_9NOCA|nr:PucR family transcriptional regulator [Nocardia huaxiensis]QLY30497.1 helix-turn-helix domain-containing protein [Nocardia huaxiensis]UFS95904.1 helix-turn-helix domain-containing protein [Nocardia huaxiensis]